MLNDWITRKNNTYNISYGATRGASKRAIANYTGYEYEDLVKNIGENGIYDFHESFRDWFIQNKLDFAFTCSLRDLTDDMGVATVDGIVYKNLNYPLHTQTYILSTNTEEYVKWFEYLHEVLRDLTVLHPYTYIRS